MSNEEKVVPISERKMQEVFSDSRVASEGFGFTANMLESHLYGRNTVSPLDVEHTRKERISSCGQDSNKKFGCSKCQASGVPSAKKECHCPTHEPLQSLRKLVHVKVQEKHYDVIQPSYAVTSFPDEVQLCTSSIPGAKYGVCTKKRLPTGTWIGPYEGRRTVDQRQMNLNENNEYLWEIYEGGKFSHFIDGSDENSSSWMRFIRCARNKKEQNMSAFQYGQNIYYRSFCDIPAGEELLVWYSDSYLKHVEIPLCLKETEQANFEARVIRKDEKESRATSSPPGTSVSNDYSTKHTISETQRFPCSQAPKTYDQEHAAEMAKSTVMYSTQSFEPVAPTIQQTLANQIKERRERMQSQSKEPKSPHINELSDLPHREQLKVNCNEKEYHDRYSKIGNIETGMGDSSGFKGPLLDDLCSPFKCRQCSKVFTQRIQLQMHVCPKSPYKPFQCGHCSLSFAQPLELRNHVVVHTNERPFKCGFCGRSFAGATTLNNHVRTHTGEKPFVCSSCGKTFSIATQLSRHMRIPGECAGYTASESVKPSQQYEDSAVNEQV